MRSNKFWVIILGGLLVLSAITAFLLAQTPAQYAVIYKEGEQVAAVDLLMISKPLIIVIDEDADPRGIGGINTIEAEQGRIRMLEADCPDGSCVRQGWARSGVVPIVCLPNRVIIILNGSNNELDIDAVVG